MLSDPMSFAVEIAVPAVMPSLNEPRNWPLSTHDPSSLSMTSLCRREEVRIETPRATGDELLDLQRVIDRID